MRAGIFDGASDSHLLVALLPFPVLLSILALIPTYEQLLGELERSQKDHPPERP